MGGYGGTVLITSWKCNFSIYLDIQAITIIYAFYWLFMCCFLLFSHFSTLQPLSWKVTFSGTKKIIEPTVFNLQASDWLHCEEETGAHLSMPQFPLNWLVFFILILKVAYFGTKKYVIFKKSLIFFFFFFFKPALRSTYICTICTDNFKFTLSLKLNGQLSFIAMPPNAFLFSITRFLYDWQKIFTNKNIFSKHVLHVLFISFFSKMYN